MIPFLECSQKKKGGVPVYVANRAKRVKRDPFKKKRYTGYVPKNRKVLDYNALQERKDMVENRLVRKVFW